MAGRASQQEDLKPNDQLQDAVYDTITHTQKEKQEKGNPRWHRLPGQHSDPVEANSKTATPTEAPHGPENLGTPTVLVDA